MREQEVDAKSLQENQKNLDFSLCPGNPEIGKEYDRL